MPSSAAQQVVGMIGCVVMPHNLFLHSALVQSRVIPRGEERQAFVFFSVEASMAIFTSFLINMSVVAVFAKGFHGRLGSDELGLSSAGFQLGEAFGSPLRVVWALGLVASGQSSTMTGTYAGQWVMQGYLNLKVKPWKRAVITRGLALVPTLAVAIYVRGSSGGLDTLNGFLNVLQSFVLPFALVPLLFFAGSRSVMGSMALPSTVLTVCWLCTGLVVAANVYLVMVQFDELLPRTFLVAFLSVYIVGVVCIGWAAGSRGRDLMCSCDGSVDRDAFG
jgi:natural resistance-associated macrophage protein